MKTHEKQIEYLRYNWPIYKIIKFRVCEHFKNLTKTNKTLNKVRRIYDVISKN
ncbi:MAG: hypothetical protein Unbinned5123contig1000_25 [Prokaryotic dsDNA virus sp.]|nr:MAG: hypothetical protein Unbinned5123contig1000_25 [Prokaryotic dsDNA virus sp.]